MKMFKSLIVVCFAALALLGLSCQPAGGPANTAAGNGGGNNSGGNNSGGKALKLAFVTNNASDYWTIARKGVEKADAELDNVSGGLTLNALGTVTDLVDGIAPVSGVVNTAVSTVEGVTGLSVAPVTNLVAGL